MIKANTGGSMVLIARRRVGWISYSSQHNQPRIHGHGSELCPGFGRAEEALDRAHAMERLDNVDELNHLAVLLASDASSFMTGSDLVIDVSHPHVCCYLLLAFTNSMIRRLHCLVSGKAWDLAKRNFLRLVFWVSYGSLSFKAREKRDEERRRKEEEQKETRAYEGYAGGEERKDFTYIKIIGRWLLEREGCFSHGDGFFSSCSSALEHN
jgi:hypothetical protein